ncbi:MAG TPA: aldo/keto reductase [Solirubrobacteraceae bacterium]|nr:aldo/keto reductase [Solirubrobacteraceae bacterium]
MQLRQLGRSGLFVSELSLGTMTFGGSGGFASVGTTDVKAARRHVDMAIDAGVNCIDTADMYSGGLAEEIVGEVLEGRRDDLILATKVRFTMPPGGRNDGGLSRHHVVRGAEASLRRLRTDHIDLYQVHEWDGLTPLEETLAALDHLVSSGKVRYVGCSNYTAWQMLKALGISERRLLASFVSTQVYYSLQERSIEHEIVPACLSEGLGILVWSPLAAGLLTGKYRRGEPAPEGTRGFSGWREPPVYDEDRLYDTIDALTEIAAGHGASPARVALAWLLGRPGVSTAIVGARTDEQLADNLAAVELRLSEDELDRLERVSRPDLPYPLWHQVMSAADRFSAADLAGLGPHVAARAEG